MPRPFAQIYPVSLGIAIAILIPFIVTVTAAPLYERQITQATGTSPQALSLITGLSEAGYAVGALIGGDLGQRFKQRPVWLSLAAILAISCAIEALARNAFMYGIGLVFMGTATGTLVILSLPPVIRRFPPKLMPITAAFVNIGFFGASAAGPLIGGGVATMHGWRWFLGVLACVAALCFLLGLFTLPENEPPNRDLRFDRAGVILAAVAVPLIFVATSELTSHSFATPLVLATLVIGLVCFAALIVTQVHQEEPLSPVKPMWSTFPVVGMLAAMFGGAAFITFVQLASDFLGRGVHLPPLHIGVEFWPQLAGAVIGAIVLGLVIPRGYLPLLILSGVLALLGGGALLISMQPENPGALLYAAAGLLGYGAGATVSPGLYLAGFSLPSPQLGRTFALVELMRATADYCVAPVVRYLAHLTSGGEAIVGGGFRIGVGTTILMTLAAALLGAVIYLAGKGFALPHTDIPGWLQKNDTAIDSPPLWSRLAGRHPRDRKAVPRHQPS